MENIKVIMENAHNATARIRKVYPEADYRVTLAAALRNAWKDATNPATAAEEWEELSRYPEALVDRIHNMVFYARAKDSAETGKDGSYRANRFNWMHDESDITACVNEAYIRMAEYIAADKWPDKPFQAILYNAVVTAAQYIDRQEKRNARAIRQTEDENGNASEYIIDNGAPLAERIAPSPEEYAIFSETINGACNDHVDVEIMRGMIYGLKQRELAEYADMSQQAISKRIKAIKARYEDNKAPDEYAADMIAYRIRKRLIAK